MAYANPGDRVSIPYTGRLDDGTVFDTSQGRGAAPVHAGGGKRHSGLRGRHPGHGEGEVKTASPASKRMESGGTSSS